MHRPDDHPDPNRWLALWVTPVAGFMTLLDVTIVVAVALPSMQRDLHASTASVQWVVSGYALAFALTLVAAGRTGDTSGRRRVFLVAPGRVRRLQRRGRGRTRRHPRRLP
ncbi:hypothetical protein GCM10010279_19150 [Streptomyces mutabilis]|nr:hypothetical protein GCM10010279_19150 [Streptomyces mutabilis]